MTKDYLKLQKGFVKVSNWYNDPYRLTKNEPMPAIQVLDAEDEKILLKYIGTEDSYIDVALEFAFNLHKKQTRKGTNTPYFVHILDVAKILMYETKDQEVIIAGILHDTLEDTDYTKEKLIHNFGEDVFNLVNFCTEPENNISATDEQQKSSWKKRKQHSIDSLKTATNEQLLVFLADKLSNLQSIHDDIVLTGDEVWKKFNAPYDDIKWYYLSIREEMRKRVSSTRTFKLFDNLIDKVFKEEK